MNREINSHPSSKCAADQLDCKQWPIHMEKPKRCVVIGGSGELGRAICRALLIEGSAVGLTYFQNETIAREFHDDFPQLATQQVDLRNLAELPAKLKRLTDHLGGCDALIHCAAICLSPGDHVPENAPQKISDVSTAGWDELMRVNLDSVFFSCQQIVATMRECGGGNVVLVGSVSGTRPLPSPVHYATSRTALEGMARAMAKELGGDKT